MPSKNYPTGLNNTDGLFTKIKKNEFNNLILHVTGESRKKSDLIITNGRYTIAIEVKSGTDSLPLRTNSDIITYFANYNDKKTYYLDGNNETIFIDDFTIATFFSPDGFLVEGDTLRQCSERHYNSYLHGRNPKTEYSESFQIIRGSMWDVIKYNGYYNKYKKLTTGIGAVLSTILDGDPLSKPAFFVMKNHIRWDGSNMTWWHQWIRF